MTHEDIRPLSDHELMAVNDAVYNGFWRRYRGRVPERQSSEWDRIEQHAEQLVQRFGHHPLVVHQVQDFLDQLEIRCSGKEGDVGR